MTAAATPLEGFASAAVAIGASTGGPPVIERILRALPADFPAPVAVCQHISPGFVEQWADYSGRSQMRQVLLRWPPIDSAARMTRSFTSRSSETSQSV